MWCCSVKVFCTFVFKECQWIMLMPCKVQPVIVEAIPQMKTVFCWRKEKSPWNKLPSLNRPWSIGPSSFLPTRTPSPAQRNEHVSTFIWKLLHISAVCRDQLPEPRNGGPEPHVPHVKDFLLFLSCPPQCHPSVGVEHASILWYWLCKVLFPKVLWKCALPT